MTLLELMLALTITALVAAAIFGMMGAVTSGLLSNQDSRNIMVRAHAAQNRISAYVTRANAILDSDGESIAIWLDDSRESGTVHATEIRWLIFDGFTGSLYVYFVTFPDAWSRVAIDLEDAEYAIGTDWNAVLLSFDAKGLLSSMPLMDGLQTVAIELNDRVETARHVGMDLGFTTSSGAQTIRVSATIRFHEAPN